MRLRNTLLFVGLMFWMAACSSGTDEGHTDAPVTGEDTATVNTDPGKTTTDSEPETDVPTGAEHDAELAAQGEELFKKTCAACHASTSQRLVGPGLGDIRDRRDDAWIIKMIMDPEGMVVDDEVAKALFEEYNGIPMPATNLTEEEATALVEYFKTTGA